LPSSIPEVSGIYIIGQFRSVHSSQADCCHQSNIAIGHWTLAIQDG